MALTIHDQWRSIVHHNDAGVQGFDLVHHLLPPLVANQLDWCALDADARYLWKGVEGFTCERGGQ